jgi:phosphopantothenoylcysteine decarboxylase/phosphopantothenate--cysteine ligase
VPRILLGVSGGIAAYKVLEFVRLATAAGHSLRVIQTPNSRRFVGEASFAALTGAPVLVNENTLAKLAGGHAQDLLSSCALAAACPLVIAPAMNNNMYEHPATQANLRALRERGVHVVEPDSGRLASKGEQGVGRLPEPARLLSECESLLAEAGAGALRGLHVLVTAGGTREPIDSVRFIGNSSSGRMGIALAQAAHARGAEVTVIAANVLLPPPAGVAWCEVRTAAELKDACEAEFPACDVLLMAAAVADFRPAAPADTKIKKAARDGLCLELEPTADVLSGLAAQRREGQTLVGFAAEHGAGAVAHGRGKLLDKGLDAVVVNDISRPDIGFEAQDNEVTILTAAGERHIPRTAKSGVAEAILDVIGELRGALQ